MKNINSGEVELSSDSNNSTTEIGDIDEPLMAHTDDEYVVVSKNGDTSPNTNELIADADFTDREQYIVSGAKIILISRADVHTAQA